MAEFGLKAVHAGADLPINDGENEIKPSIVHTCLEIGPPEELGQKYNCIEYRFFDDEHQMMARFYFDEGDAVVLYDVVTSSDLKQMLGPLDIPLRERVLAYLKRRYPRIEALGPGGRTVIWDQG